MLFAIISTNELVTSVVFADVGIGILIEGTVSP